MIRIVLSFTVRENIQSGRFGGSNSDLSSQDHLRPLQSVQNAAARLALKLRKFDGVSISITIRNELHWLPVHKRIVYKLCLDPCVQMSTRAGPNMPVVTLFAAVSCHNPSSAAGSNLDYTRTRTVTYGSRAFAVSGPTCWNLIPSSLKSSLLKPAHFYGAAWNADAV